MIRDRQSGFTLVELMITIAVLGIAAAIAVPNFLSQMPQWRLNGAARQVMGDLMAARMQAVKENTSVTVAYMNKQQYTVSNGTATTTKDIGTNYSDVTIGADFGNIVFSSRGTLNPPTRTIILSSSSGPTKSITVLLTGRVRIK